VRDRERARTDWWLTAGVAGGERATPREGARPGQILQKRLANFECHSVSVNTRYCHLTKFFIFFHSKFEMPSYMKVVSLDKLDNFHKGRFLSV
jgi:hypothetical protein